MRSKSTNLKGDTVAILFKAEAICFKVSIEKESLNFFNIGRALSIYLSGILSFGIAIGNPKRLRIFAWGSRKDIFTPPPPPTRFYKLRIKCFGQVKNKKATSKSHYYQKILLVFCFLFFLLNMYYIPIYVTFFSL